MIATTSLADAVTHLLLNPKPILCLDTCDFLDVIRSLEEKGNTQSEVACRLLGILIDDPDRVQLVITDLVRHEWGQNIDEARRRASDHLKDTDQRIGRVMSCCQHAQVPALQPIAIIAQIPIIGGLIELAENLMNLALMLEKDGLCIEKALSRVMDRRRPSHKGEIKDSIHLEHYLEFSRQLTQSGFTVPRLFVSANKTEFWDGPPQLHRDLRDEFDSVGLQFFGKLDAALGRLGI